jgi:hypothetical protein
VQYRSITVAAMCQWAVPGALYPYALVVNRLYRVQYSAEIEGHSRSELQDNDMAEYCTKYFG